MKGYFKPKNPQKYVGNVNNIVYRSSYEVKVLMCLDHSDKVEHYASEEFSIPYWDPTRKSVHRYFPDFWVKFTDGLVYVFEVKPASQTKQPQSKNKRRLLKESITYARNLAKWKSARTFCEDKGWEFKILTEKEIFGPQWGFRLKS